MIKYEDVVSFSYVAKRSHFLIIVGKFSTYINYFVKIQHKRISFNLIGNIKKIYFPFSLFFSSTAISISLTLFIISMSCLFSWSILTQALASGIKGLSG